jgi:hypothetical protein
MFEIERSPPPPMAMAGRLGTTVGTVDCPKCGQPVNARPGSPGYLIAECPTCLNTLVATNTLAGSTLRPGTGGVPGR